MLLCYTILGVPETQLASAFSENTFPFRKATPLSEQQRALSASGRRQDSEATMGPFRLGEMFFSFD